MDPKIFYTATFVSYALKRQKSWAPKTIVLFKNMRDEKGKNITKRAWANATKSLLKLDLQPGDRLSFQAHIQKHELSTKKSYRLTHISKIKKIYSPKK